MSATPSAGLGSDFDMGILLREKEKWMKIQVASSAQRLRHRIPTVDTAANPFCAERQLRDAMEQHEVNKVRARSMRRLVAPCV